MKKIIIAAVVGLLVIVAGGGWYILGRSPHNPVQQAKLAMQRGDARAAGIELRNAVRDQPANAEAHALLSELQVVQGDGVAAEKEIKRAAELNWPKERVQPILAQAYLQQGKWPEIRAEIPRAGATAEATGYFLMTHAIAERSQNDTARAKATMAEAEQANPNSAEVAVAAARLAIATGDQATALSKLDHAIELDPKRTDALSLKAELLAASGDRTGAIALMDKAIETAPANNGLRLERANLYLAQGQDAKAREDVQAILARDAKNPSAQYFDMVLLIRQGKFADADQVVQRLDPIIARFPRGLYFKAIVKASIGQNAQAEDSAVAYLARQNRDPDGVRLLARVQMAARRPDRAVATLAAAVNAGQNDAETLDLLGRAYVMSGNRAEGEAAFKRASTAVNSSPTALTRVASSRLQAGDLAGAATDLERSLDIAPAQPGAGQALVGTALALGDLDKAQEALDRLKLQTGDTETTALLAGFIKLARLDQQGALDEFNTGLQKFPGSPVLQVNAAKLLFALNRRPEAEALLRQALEKTPTAAEPLTILVQILVAEGRGADAIAAVERARAAAPKDLGLARGHAELLAQLHDVPGALQVLDSTKVDGRIPVGLLPLLGRLQLQAGQNDAARATFESLVAAEPTNAIAVRNQVELLVRLKDFEGARRAAQAAVQRQPSDPALPGLLVAVELQEKGIDTALATADRLRADPATARVSRTLRGDLLLNARRFKEAADVFAAELKQDPSPVLAMRLATAQANAGDVGTAEAGLRRWQADHPGDPDTANMLASLDLKANRYGDAERNLQTVLAQRPSDPIALNNLAWIYQTRGDRRARQMAQRAYGAAPTPESGDTLAWILVSQGESAKALPILRNAVAARPDNPTLKYHLAVALKDVKRNEEALSVLRPIVENGSGFDEKPAAQKLLADLTSAKP